MNLSRKREKGGNQNELNTYLGELPQQIGKKLLNKDLKGKTILIICGGNGSDSEYWTKEGAIVTITDISETAIKNSKKRYPNINAEVQNAENLTYDDDSFDYVFVRAGLHHLPRPQIGVYEMLRVAKKGILFMEGHDSFIMNFLRKIGVVLTIEPSGNYVYTFTRREINKICNAMFLPRPRIKTYFYQYIRFLNGRIYTKMNGKVWLRIYKFFLRFINFFIGRRGNGFVCYISKTKE